MPTHTEHSSSNYSQSLKITRFIRQNYIMKSEHSVNNYSQSLRIIGFIRQNYILKSCFQNWYWIMFGHFSSSVSSSLLSINMLYDLTSNNSPLHPITLTSVLRTLSLSDPGFLTLISQKYTEAVVFKPDSGPSWYSASKCREQ